MPQKPNSEKIKMSKERVRRENINLTYSITKIDPATEDGPGKGGIAVLEMSYAGTPIKLNQVHADSRIIKILLEENEDEMGLEMIGKPDIGKSLKDPKRISTKLTVRVPDVKEFEYAMETYFKKELYIGAN